MRNECLRLIGDDVMRYKDGLVLHKDDRVYCNLLCEYGEDSQKQQQEDKEEYNKIIKEGVR